MGQSPDGRGDRGLRLRAVLAALAVIGAACGAPGPATTQPAQPAAAGASPSPSPSPSPTPSPEEEPEEEPEEPRLSDGELAELGVNEVGRVLVMEWHDVEDQDSRWANSRETFRAQIAELYERGYRPVTTEEFASGTMPIPEGTTPVLLTFDDSYRSHLWFGDDGEPHPDSVVGILEDFSEENPDWRATAVFYIYWPVPFRETEREVIESKLRWLVDNGYEIGNHSHTHEDLSALDDTGVRETLGKAQAEIEAVIPGYRLRSLSLPFGLWPDDPATAVSGAFEGTTYEHDLVLLVGFMPTRSPHHAEYDPTQVQRVQAYVPEFRKWVGWMDDEPGRRFVSDGDPATVTYPTSHADVATPRDGFEVRIYEAPAAD